MTESSVPFTLNGRAQQNYSQRGLSHILAGGNGKAGKKACNVRQHRSLGETGRRDVSVRVGSY